MIDVAAAGRSRAHCIRYYSCISVCPNCYFVDRTTRDPDYASCGEVPLNFMFRLIRFAHIADSCVNCGQCQELRPSEIPKRALHALPAG